MKQRERRLKKLEQDSNLNDEPLRIMIESTVIGQPEKTIYTEVVWSKDCNKVGKSYKLVNGEKVFIEDRYPSR